MSDVNPDRPRDASRPSISAHDAPRWGNWPPNFNAPARRAKFGRGLKSASLNRRPIIRSMTSRPTPSRLTQTYPFQSSSGS